MSLEIAMMKLAENVGRIADAMEGKAKGKPAPAPEQEPPAAPAKRKTTAAEPASGLDYVKDVKPKALELANVNRPALLAIYKKFGVAVGTELKPAQYPEALAQIEAALAGEEDDVA